MSTKNIKLSNLQISVMKILWNNEQISVRNVHKLMNEVKPIALTTVATLLKRMEEKNIVGFEKNGRQHVYFPHISESDVKSSMLGNMLSHLFNNKPAELVHHLVDQDNMTEDELVLIRKILSQEASND